MTAPPQTPAPARAGARQPGGFYGWHVMAYSAIALAATAPGQTAAVSVFIDPLIVDLGMTRSQVSGAYLVGTLAGAAAMPLVGSALDRFGVRRTMAMVGAAFGAVLVSLSVVSGIVGLTAGFVGIRMLGQGALGLVATTASALWFVRRRGTVLGVVSSAGAAVISLAPVGLERLISAEGWRTAWLVEGLVVWAVVVPLALLGMRDRPADLGQVPDGRPVAGAPEHTEWGLPRAAAVRSGFFWVVCSAVATTGMLSTAVAFHQISLLGERGLSTAAAAANFIPQTVAALVATIGTGWLVDRFSPRWATSAAMLTLAGALVWGAFLTDGWSAIGFGLAIGLAGGSIRSLEAASFPRYFGTTHLGSIRGLVAFVSVGSTAFGPLLFALVHDLTGSYRPALLGSAVLPLVVAALGVVVGPPDGGTREDQAPP